MQTEYRPITFPHRMESVMQTPSILRGPIGYGHVLKNVSTGRILQDSNEACICNEEFVQIINVNDGDVTQEWKCSYGKIYYMTVAMCSTHQFIIVAASSDAASSIIVILKVPSLTVLNLFFFPGEVTCLSMLTSNAEFCISNNCCLSRSDEILAVGSHGGKVHLLGLNISRSLSKPGHHPISLKLVDHRASLEEAFHDGHSAVVLFQDFTKDGTYVYQKCCFPVEEVHVSAISFVQQLSSVFVGLSIGCFIVFNLCNLAIAYTSPCSLQRISPIIDFVYMEPENDPKCFVYVWVARGNRKKQRCTSCEFETKLTLYQLMYYKKSISLGRTLYSGFQGCVPRMEYALTGTPILSDPQKSLASQLFGCFSTTSFRNLYDLNISEEELKNEEDETVAVFVWSAEFNFHRQYFIAVFDINQWYQAQMPNVVKWKMLNAKYSGVLGCSYFAFFSLDQLADQGQDILDICVEDVSSFPSHSPVPPTHEWPSSMKFRASVLKKSSISSCTFLGVPRSVLHEINISQNILSQPDELFLFLKKAEFLSPSEDDSMTSEMQIKQQQKEFLSTLLDHDIPSQTIAAVVDNWITSKFTGYVVTELLFDEIKRFNFEERTTHLLLKRLGTLQRFLDICCIRLSPDICSGITQNFELITVQRKVSDITVFCISKGVFDISPFTAFRNDKSRMSAQRLREEFGQPVCPPTSVDDILVVLKSFDVKSIHCYMLYFLCELQSLMPKLGDIVVCYAESMCLPSSLVQVIEVFWMIDHGLYKDIEKSNFFSGSVHTRPVFEWQHEFILNCLMTSGLDSLSLKYILSYDKDMLSVAEIKMKMAIYIANSRVTDGYNILRSFRDSHHYSTLLKEFIILCSQGNFNFFLNADVSALDKNLVMQHISRSKSCGVDVMLFYLLMTDNVSYALKVYEDLFKSLNPSLKEAVNIYIHLLENSCELKFVEAESSSVKKLVEVNESFSAAVGKSNSSCEVLSHMETIYNVLNTRCRASTYQPITESDNSTSFVGDTYMSFQGIQTPKRKVTSTCTESVTRVKMLSPFAVFLTDFDGFKNRMPCSDAEATPKYLYSAGVSTPVFDEIHKELHANFSSTPTSILKQLSGPKQHHSKSIRFVIESPDETPTYTNRSSLDVQPKEEIEIFGSPLDSPSKFGSQQCYAEVGTDNIFSVDSERQNMTYDDSDNENVASSSAELPRIQLTSHASLCTPVQSDSTNRIIYSSSVFPSATTSGLSLSIHDVDLMENTQRPTSSLVFSPPLTRSAVRRSQKIPTSIDGTKTAPIALFDPQLTPGGDFDKKSTKQRKLKTQTSSIGVRRSARLLKGKK